LFKDSHLAGGTATCPCAFEILAENETDPFSSSYFTPKSARMKNATHQGGDGPLGRSFNTTQQDGITNILNSLLYQPS
jgi:hypothetical protein